MTAKPSAHTASAPVPSRSSDGRSTGFGSTLLDTLIPTDTLVAPAQLALRLDELDLSARMPGLRNVIGLWRSPEQVGSSASWSAPTASLTDVYLFGEAGMFGARRGKDGAPAVIKPGPHGAPRELPGSSISGEILLTPRGTLGLRGPMVTVAAYAPPPPSSDSLIPPQPRDYVDTDYAARLERATGAINITAPPSGVRSRAGCTGCPGGTSTHCGGRCTGVGTRVASRGSCAAGEAPHAAQRPSSARVGRSLLLGRSGLGLDKEVPRHL